MTTEANTFPKLLLHHASCHAGRPAMREKRYGIWKTWTWAELLHEVQSLALGLAEAGVMPGERVAIIGNNRARLYWSILAAQCLGAVPVPIYPDAVADEMAFLLAHARTCVAIVEDQEQVDKLLSIRDELPLLRLVAYEDSRGLRDYPRTGFLVSLDEIIARGRELGSGEAIAPRFADLVARTEGDDTSIILYTSGTTGRPKGTVIAAERAIKAAAATVTADGLDATDEVVAYLPIAWGGDHYLNYAQALVAGFCMSCPEEPETVAEDMREIGPTFYFAPPRVFENLLTRIMIAHGGCRALKRWLFDYFMTVARRWGEAILDGRPVPLPAVCSMVSASPRSTGRSRTSSASHGCGSPTLPARRSGPTSSAFFRSLGINLKQLYGQTEAFLYISAQPNGEIRAETVGPPAPASRSASPKVARSSSARQACSWLLSRRRAHRRDTRPTTASSAPGDAGFFDRSGHLRIIDRAKDVGLLTDGDAVRAEIHREQAQVLPEHQGGGRLRSADRPFATVLHQHRPHAVGNWAERNNVIFASYQELAALPQVYDIVRGHIRQVNRAPG
jgi:long-chain acyl-CoA synthetase